MENSRSRRKVRSLRRDSGSAIWQREQDVMRQAPCDGFSVDSARGEDCICVSERLGYSIMPVVSKRGFQFSMDGNSSADRFQTSSSKGDIGTPIKRLISQEMAKERAVKRHSPSLVARLMGLDAFPSFQTNDHEKETKTDDKKILSRQCHEVKLKLNEDYTHCESKNFNDVFEVSETLKPKTNTGQLNPRSKLEKSNRRGMDMSFIREKFKDAKRFSTDEVLLQSKDFDDALEALDSNRDLFLKFLQEPNSLFSKHMQGVRSLPPQSTNDITGLKPSNVAENFYSNKRKIKSKQFLDLFSHERKGRLESKNSQGKYTTNFTGQSSFLHESSNNHQRRHSSRHPTHIVVLKPDYDTVHNMEMNASPGVSGDFSFATKKQYRSDKGRDKGDKRKSSKEIVCRRNTDQLENSSYAKKLSILEKFNYQKEKLLSEETIFSRSNSSQWASEKYNCQDDEMTSLRSYSVETSVNHVARKHLSKRLKMARLLREAGVSHHGSPNTLGAMLALSDRDMTRATLAQIISADCKARVVKNVLSSTLDGCKEENPRKLLRSLSLPSSSPVSLPPKSESRSKMRNSGNLYTIKDTLNLGFGDSYEDCRSSGSSYVYVSNRSPPHQYSEVVEREIMERDIHVAAEELREIIDKPEVSKTSESSEAVKSTSRCSGDLVENILISESIVSFEDEVMDHSPHRSSSSIPEFNSNIFQNIAIKEETSSNLLSPDPISVFSNSTGSASPRHVKEIDQPSPVSVFDVPDEEETCSSGCFDKISKGLKELRNQVRLLKLEILNECEGDNKEEEEEEEEEEEDFFQDPIFVDKDDRNCSSLSDVLAGMDLHLINRDGDRVDQKFSEVFEKLERKYGMSDSSLRSDRKLLFDLIRETSLGQNWKLRLRPVGVLPQRPSEDVWKAIDGFEKGGEGKKRVAEEECAEGEESLYYLVVAEIEEAVGEFLLEEIVAELLQGFVG